MTLIVDGERAARIVSRSGETLRTLSPPEAYSFSHAEGPETLVCRGEAPVDGWWDWRFAVDPRTGALTRIGPVY